MYDVGGAMVWWLIMQTHKTGVVSSSPTCVTMKRNAIGKEGNGKPSHKVHFPRKISEPWLWSLLCLKLSMQCSSTHSYCKAPCGITL